MRNKFLLFVGICLVPLTVMGQEIFNGTIKVRFSQNAIAKEIEAVGYGDKIGDRFFAWIDKKAMTRANAHANAYWIRTNGMYDRFVKVKGDKVVIYDSKKISFILLDGVKDSIYTVYPTYNVGTRMSIDEYLDEVYLDGAVMSNPEETDIVILGYKCKLVSSMQFTDSTSMTRVWYNDSIKMPKKYVECYMYDGMFGFPLLQSINVEDGGLFMLSYSEVTDIIEETVPDEVFRIPEGVKFVSTDEINSYLFKEPDKPKKTGNNKGIEITQETVPPVIGIVYPESLWDY